MKNGLAVGSQHQVNEQNHLNSDSMTFNGKNMTMNAQIGQLQSKPSVTKQTLPNPGALRQNHLNSDSTTFNGQNMTMNAQIDQLQSELSVTRQTLTNSGAQRQNHLNSNSTTFNDQNKTMDAQIDQLQSELSVTKQTLTNVLNKLSEAESASSGKDSIIEELRLELQHLNAERAEFKEQIRSLKVTVNSLYEELTLLEEKAEGRCALVEQ